MARRKKSKKEIPLLILIIAIIGYIFATYGENLSSSLTEEGNLNQNNRHNKKARIGEGYRWG